MNFEQLISAAPLVQTGLREKLYCFFQMRETLPKRKAHDCCQYSDI